MFILILYICVYKHLFTQIYRYMYQYWHTYIYVFVHVSVDTKKAIYLYTYIAILIFLWPRGVHIVQTILQFAFFQL